MTDYQKAAQVARELRQLAQELNLTIITAQQRPPIPRFYTVAEHTEAMQGVIIIDHIGLLRHNEV